MTARVTQLDEEQNWNWNMSFLFYANYVSLSAMGKTSVRGDFTEEELELPTCPGAKYPRGTGSSGQRHKDAAQRSQLRKQNMVSRM